MKRPEKRERVLIAQAIHSVALEAARTIASEGYQPIIVRSLAQARHAKGPFALGKFSFDLPDGSGIVLAAEMLFDGSVGRVDFFHPIDESRVDAPNRTRIVPMHDRSDADRRVA